MYTSVLVNEPSARLGHTFSPPSLDHSLVHSPAVRRYVSDNNTVSFTFESPLPQVRRSDLPPFSCKRKDRVVFADGVPSSIALELQVNVLSPLLVREVHDDADTIISVPYVTRDKRYFAAEFPDTDILVVEHLFTGRIIRGPFHVFRRLNPFEKFMSHVMDFRFF